jgi:hypothetical protein
MELPAVSVIVVNFNGKHFLGKCFSSLQALNYPQEKLELIMADNGSKDGSIQFMKKNFPKVVIIKNRENNYCKANNLGIKKARGEFVALLNNDVRVDRGWLVELVKAVRKNKRIGAVVSKVLLEDGRICHVGSYDRGNFEWTGKGFGEKDKGQYDRGFKIEALSNTAAIYRRTCLDDVGLLDDDLVMYAEDVDFTFRMLEKGWKLGFAPKSIVWHKNHGTIKRFKQKERFYTSRNRLIMIAKYFPGELVEQMTHSNFFWGFGPAILEKELPLIFQKWKYPVDQKAIEGLTESFVKIKKELNQKKNEIKRGRLQIRQKDRLLLETKQQNKDLRKKNRQLKEARSALEKTIENNKKELHQIKSTRGWKIMTAVHQTKKSLGMVK